MHEHGAHRDQKRSEASLQASHAPQADETDSRKSSFKRPRRPAKTKCPTNTSDSDSEYDTNIGPTPARKCKPSVRQSKRTEPEVNKPSERHADLTNPGQFHALDSAISSQSLVAVVDVSQSPEPTKLCRKSKTDALLGIQSAGDALRGTCANSDATMASSTVLGLKQQRTACGANAGIEDQSGDIPDRPALSRKPKASVFSVLVGPKKLPPTTAPDAPAMPPIHIVQRPLAESSARGTSPRLFRLSLSSMLRTTEPHKATAVGPPLRVLLHHSHVLDAHSWYLQHASAPFIANTKAAPVATAVDDTTTALHSSCMDTAEHALLHTASPRQKGSANAASTCSASNERQNASGQALVRVTSPRKLGGAAVQANPPLKPGDGQAWVQKYSPARAEDVCGNADVALRILTWLQSYYPGASKGPGADAQSGYATLRKCHLMLCNDCR